MGTYRTLVIFVQAGFLLSQCFTSQIVSFVETNKSDFFTRTLKDASSRRNDKRNNQFRDTVQSKTLKLFE